MEKQLFYDELGSPVEFIVKAKFTFGDHDYVAMIPLEDLEGETYILRVEVDENGEDLLSGIGDEELKLVIDAYEELMEEKLQ